MYALAPYPLYRRRVRRASTVTGLEALRLRVVDWLMEGLLTVLLPPVAPSATITFPPDKPTALSGTGIRSGQQTPANATEPPPPYMTPVGTRMPRALELDDIIHLILDELAHGEAVNRTLARLARVSSRWFRPSVSRLYRNTSDKNVRHLLKILFPQPDETGWFDTSRQAWDRFALYSDCVLTLTLHNFNRYYTRPFRWKRTGLSINLFRDLRLSIEADPSRTTVFLRLQHLDVELPYDVSLGATVVLLSPCLRSLKVAREVVPRHDSLSWSTRRDLKAYCYGLSEWTPHLQVFGLSGQGFEALTDADLLVGLQHLRSLDTVELPSKLQAAMSLLVRPGTRDTNGLQYDDSLLRLWPTFDFVTTIQLCTAPGALATLLETASLPRLTTFEITLTAPEADDSIVRMNALLVEKAPMLQHYSILRTGAQWKSPFPIQPVASDFAPLAELAVLKTLHLQVFLAADEFPYQATDDHAFVILLLIRRCSKLRYVGWDWPIATTNLPAPQTLVDLASASPELKQLTIPANLTFADLVQMQPQTCLERLVLASGSVYLNKDKSHRWLSALWPNAKIEDYS